MQHATVCQPEPKQNSTCIVTDLSRNHNRRIFDFFKALVDFSSLMRNSLNLDLIHLNHCSIDVQSLIGVKIKSQKITEIYFFSRFESAVAYCCRILSPRGQQGEPPVKFYGEQLVAAIIDTFSPRYH